MKKYLFSLFLFLATTFIYAQSPTFKWARNMGGPTGSTVGTTITTDAAGNVYTAGAFQGTVDFDPGAGTFELTYNGGSRDIFVSKLDASGNFVWAKSMGGTSDDFAYGLAIDGSGNVYLAGNFGATVDFDPGAGTSEFTAVGYYDIFITKLNSSGNFVWTKTVGGTDYDYATDLALDANGNILVTGSFTGTVDFDPGAATVNLTAAGTPDMYILKLDAAGNYIWSKNIGDNGAVYGLSITSDANSNVYTTGNFSGIVDFDLGSPIVNLSSPGSDDIFVCKLNASGNFVWAGNMGGPVNDFGKGIAVDAAGNVYTTGYFDQKGDFDPGPGTYNINATSSSEDVFVSKLDVSGNFVWAKNMGGYTGDRANSIALDNNGNVYTTGFFQATADFNPGTDTANLRSAAYQDIFISKLNKAGNFVWAVRLGGASTDMATAIHLDITGNIYTTGSFNSTVDFDQSASILNLSSHGQADIFIHKMYNPVTGISAVNTNDHIVIYPNPTTGILNLSGLNGSDNYTLEVTNNLGQIVFKQTDLNEKNSIDLNHLANGLYVVKLTDSSNIVIIFKLTKL